ncbi:MAG: hypothetical protein E6R05_07095 [Candidatus Moraniibacteriota bacterium]|nr:MAG: hypothetical protein E6R05_07095 [Candidatus Moranbacteria bacterium]
MSEIEIQVNAESFNDSDAARAFLKALMEYNKLITEQLGCSTCHASTKSDGEYPHLVVGSLTNGQIAFYCSVYSKAERHGWRRACNGLTTVKY